MTESRKNASKTYTDKAGKFVAGNPGRPPGARHRVTRAAEELLNGEAEGLTRKAVEMALEGDTTALKLCLERIVPARKDIPVHFELPKMTSATEAANAAAAIIRAVSDGRLTPLEGMSVMGLVENFRKAIETSELAVRLASLEKAIEGATT